jgi:hypothetical protein
VVIFLVHVCFSLGYCATGKFYLDTAQVSVKREEILANSTNKLKCDTISVTYTIFVCHYREVKEIVDFNTAHKQNVSPNTPPTTGLYNKPKLHYISATENDATTTTASAATTTTTTTTTSTQHRKEATGHNI